MFIQNRKSNLRRGAVLVQSVIFGSLAGLGFAAISIDTGLMYGARQELQNAADAAALAAASQLTSSFDAASLAREEASKFANINKIMGDGADLVDADLVFGHAVANGAKFDFVPYQQPYDAVQATLRRDQTVSDGPVSLLFAKVFGMSGARLEASATAMIVPRDIALVIDLSASMNDDSEFRHYRDFASDRGGNRDGVQINLKEIWRNLPLNTSRAGVQNGLNPPPPGGVPSGGNDQPGTGVGSPQSAGGNPDSSSGGSGSAGPRWGWMTGFGEPIELGIYSPTSDQGLYHIPRHSTCTDQDVIANLIESGYSSAERTALLSGQRDGNSSHYRNRVQVLLGLAGWRSGKNNAKYSNGGNGNNVIGSSELADKVDYPFQRGSWSDYLSYVQSGTTQMARTDSQLRNRYGIKTVVNYLLEKQARHTYVPELADTPEEPLFSVKNSVQTMIDEIVTLGNPDHVSLETFGQYGIHRLDLTVPESGQTLAEALQEVPDSLFGFQAGHDTPVTNIGAGMEKAVEELTSERARPAATKVIILLTDGKPNVNEGNRYVGNDNPQAVNWALDQADEAKEEGIVIYTIGVGGDVNEQLCIEAATTPDHYYFADNAPDPDNNGQPKYVNQLKEIFQTLGGKRAIWLIQ